MKGSTPKARAKELTKILASIYDKDGDESNVTDVLTDIRHLCEVKGYSLEDHLHRAYIHCLEEKHEGRIS